MWRTSKRSWLLAQRTPKFQELWIKMYPLDLLITKTYSIHQNEPVLLRISLLLLQIFFLKSFFIKKPTEDLKKGLGTFWNASKLPHGRCILGCFLLSIFISGPHELKYIFDKLFLLFVVSRTGISYSKELRTPKCVAKDYATMTLQGIGKYDADPQL